MFLTNCVFMLNRTICIKIDLALNNLQKLICHKTQRTNQPKISPRLLYSQCFSCSILKLSSEFYQR